MDTPVASLPLILPQPGFICGTVPVPTATDRHSLELVTVQASSMKVVSDSSGSLRYSFLPAEMDLNAVPPNWLKREELGPLNPLLLTNEDTQDGNAEDLCDSCSHHSLAHPLPKKCEDLAVHGLAAYGDAIDFIAPASVMKQIFKTPYSKAPISVAIHRIGKTLILNDGPDVVESTSKQSSQRMTVNKDLFNKFVHHSVNAAPAPSDLDADAAPGRPLPEGNPCRAWQFYSGTSAQSSAAKQPYVETEDGARCSASGEAATDSGFEGSPASWVPKRKGFGSKKRDKHGRALGQPKTVPVPRSVLSTSQLELGRLRCTADRAPGAAEDEPLSSDGDEGAGEKGASGPRNRERFLRVLFWQFRELQMLLGSDLLLFGNDQHKAVSLYLMEVDRPSSPLPWLDAWLDCLMAAVPEVAVCYHKAGVVQGYELLKTDDLCLLKGVAPDGTISFHPQVVHANAAAVLRFLQHNCTTEPGAYWLVKNAGEDLLQLFDLSTIADVPDESEASEGEARPLRSPDNPLEGSQRYEQALAVLIYRLALQLAHSTSSGDQRRSGQLLMQCLELMEDKEGPELVAAAHERMARLCCEPSIRPLLLEPHFLLQPPPSNQLLCANEGIPAEKSPDAQENTRLSEDADAETLESRGKMSESVTTFSADREGRSGTRRVQTEAVSSLVGSRGVESRQVQHVVDGKRGGPCLTEGAPAVTGLEEGSGTLDRPHLRASPAAVYSANAVSRKRGQERAQSEHSSFQDSAASSSEQLLKAAIQRHLSATHHFSLAIKALREELSMLSTKTPKRSPAKSDHVSGGFEVGGGQQGCSCKGARHEARVARTAGKMRALLGSLAAAYLEVGRAYEADGQLARALKAAELAALVGGCLKEGDPSKGGALPSSSPERQQQAQETAGTGGQRRKGSAQLDAPLPRPANTEVQRKAGRRESRQPAPVVPSPGFWGSLWVFVGDLHIQLQQQWSEETLLAQQASLLSGAPRLHESVAEEVERRARGRSGEGGLAGAGSSSSSSASTRGGSSETRARGKRESVAKKAGRGAAVTAAASDADLLCFGRSLCLDFDVNLTAAADSYGKGIAALEADAGEGEWEVAHRRLGWTANELGRRRLEEADISAAGDWFRGALASFVAVKDTGNAVLVHCNMGHARRGQAEAMATDRGGSEQAPAGDQLKQIRITHTCRCYQQALSHYIAARSELLSLGEAEAQRSLRGLWNEAHTQLAHTYLRFGMFLAATGPMQNSDVTTLSVPAGSKGGNPSRASWHPQGSEAAPAPSDLLTKALHLYESLGPAREQEAAYSHCQLATLFRDRCIMQMRPSPEMAPTERHVDDARYKRCAALAELHWQRALEVYRADSHPDMYIRIGVERSALGLKCAPKSRPSIAVEAALTGLEGIPPLCQPSTSTRDCTDDGNGDGFENPSKETMAALKKHLESIARDLLQVHVSFLKHRTGSDDDVTAATKETISRFKIMYKELLQLGSSITNKNCHAVGRVLRSILDERP